MISSMIGRYLLHRGHITSEQLYSLLLEKERIHVKLGLIAVSEGMMTQAQADEVYGHQAVVDKRFGELAVDMGYLTEGEVEALLDRQGDDYLTFAQALVNQKLMSVEQLEQYMDEFQSEYHLTLTDMEDLKSNDADRILPVCIPMDEIPAGDNQYLHMAGTALRTLLRFVGGGLCPKTAYFAERCEADNGVVQHMKGEQSIACGIVGKGRALLPVASAFGKKEFAGIDEEALDSVGGLLNSIGEIYAGNLKQSGILLEKDPSQGLAKIREVAAEKMLVLPLCVMGEEINFIIAAGNKEKIIDSI